MVMVALRAWAASPGKRSANSAMTALCAWAICLGEGVKRQQICLGEMRVWMRFGSTPVMFMMNFRLNAILAPIRLKVHGTKFVDALWLHPVHGKFDMDENCLHI